MKLYEYDEAIRECIDENGEIFDVERFESLNLGLGVKLEGLALSIKDDEAQEAAIKAEKNALYSREKTAANRAKSKRNYLASLLEGKKFETAKVACSFRKSVSVETDDSFFDWATISGGEFLRQKPPEIDKTALKEALKAGVDIPHACLVEKQNLQIR